MSYVGRVLTSKGLKPDDEKVRAVKEIEKPENVKELQKFLESVNYLGKFIENLSEKSEPLRKLLQKDVSWHWGKDQETAFETLRKVL